MNDKQKQEDEEMDKIAKLIVDRGIKVQEPIEGEPAYWVCSSDGTHRWYDGTVDTTCAKCGKAIFHSTNAIAHSIKICQACCLKLSGELEDIKFGITKEAAADIKQFMDVDATLGKGAKES